MVNIMKLKIMRWSLSAILTLSCLSVWAVSCTGNSVTSCSSVNAIPSTSCAAAHTTTNFCEFQRTDSGERCVDDTSKPCT